MLGKPSEIHSFHLQNHHINLANPYDCGVKTLNQQTTWAFLENGGEWQFRNPKQNMSPKGPTLLWGPALWFSCMWLHSSGQIGTIIPLNLNLKGIFFEGGESLTKSPPFGVTNWRVGRQVEPTGRKFLMFLCPSLSHSIHVIMPYLPTWKP